MKTANRLTVWFLMLAKRLIFKRSFVALLIIIPAVIPAVNTAVSQESGVVRVALCSDGDGGAAGRITEALISEESVISYTVYEDSEDAKKSVQNGENDAAWIFDADFEERMHSYISKKSIRPIVQVVQREESIRLNLAREKLFGKVYSEMAYEVYADYVRGEIMGGRFISDAELKKYYASNALASELIDIRMQGFDEEMNNDVNYLTAPLRGLLALLVMLCGFASAGYFMSEQASGTYDWLAPKKRIIPAFGSCFAATAISSAAVLVALIAGGLAVNFWYELAIMAVYALAAASFAALICTVFRRFEVFGPLIPFAMIAMLVLCPIFFSFKIMPALRLMMPPYYYLMAVYSSEYTLYMLIYSAVALVLATVLTRIKK